MISEQSLADNKLLGPGELGDAYGDGREELGLSILHQAADEYFRDLGMSKVSVSTLTAYGWQECLQGG